MYWIVSAAISTPILLAILVMSYKYFASRTHLFSIQANTQTSTKVNPAEDAPVTKEIEMQENPRELPEYTQEMQECATISRPTTVLENAPKVPENFEVQQAWLENRLNEDLSEDEALRI